MNRFLVSLSVMLFLAGSLFAGDPTDNAVASFYSGPEGYPAWTEAIKWGNVINMKSYAKGANDFEKFENARDELAAKGGGVLFYPAGTYDFKAMPADGPGGRGLMLKKGVVIRGEAPEGAAPDTVAAKMATGEIQLKTRFVFGFKDRSKVALAVGERARLRTDGSVWISVGVKDGKLNPADVEVLRRKGTTKVTTTKVVENADGFELDITGEETATPPVPWSFKAKIMRKDGVLSGDYTSKTGAQDATGKVVGRQYTSIAETPRDWNMIGLCPEKGQTVKDVDYVGICWIHLVGATVFFGPDLGWGPTWKEAGGWKSAYAKPGWADRKPDGLHFYDGFMGAPAKDPKFNGAAKGRLVMGCVFDRSAVTGDFETAGRAESKGGFGPEGFHMAKFGARVGAYGSRIFVAANAMPIFKDGNFRYEQTTVQTIAAKGNDFKIGTPHQSFQLWDYGRVMGIDINKDLVGAIKDPKTLAEGVAVLNNYVCNNGHKGYNPSGKWVVVRKNRNERTVLLGGDDPYYIGGWTLTLDGYTESSWGGGGMISDNLARAFDMAGANIWIDANEYNNTGSQPGNDGEGILCQAHGGTHVMSWAITRNQGEGGGAGRGYIAAYRVPTHGFLIAWNKIKSAVGTVGGTSEIDCCYVANTSIGVNGKGGEDLPVGIPAKPKDVKAVPYENDAVAISWADASDNEVGFRVERQIDGGPWATIAYRPPRREGHADNPQTWIDFMAPAGKKLLYRVVAVSADDTSDGASDPGGEVTLPRP